MDEVLNDIMIVFIDWEEIRRCLLPFLSIFLFRSEKVDAYTVNSQHNQHKAYE